VTAQFFIKKPGDTSTSPFSILCKDGKPLREAINTVTSLYALGDIQDDDLCLISINDEPAGSWTQPVVSGDIVKVSIKDVEANASEGEGEKNASHNCGCGPGRQSNDTELAQQLSQLKGDLDKFTDQLNLIFKQLNSEIECINNDLKKLEQSNATLSKTMAESNKFLTAIQEHVTEFESITCSATKAISLIN
jgi:hypothetical protein